MFEAWSLTKKTDAADESDLMRIKTFSPLVPGDPRMPTYPSGPCGGKKGEAFKLKT